MTQWLAPLAIVAVAASAAQPGAIAQEFAALYLPNDAVIDEAEANYRRQMTASFAVNPRSAPMEARYPGLNAALMNAGAAALRTHYAERLARMRARVAEAAEKHFAPDELTEVIAFLRSDAGRATRMALRRTMDPSGLERRMKQSPGNPPTFSQAELAASINPTGAVQALAPEHRKALAAFVQTRGGRHFGDFRPRALAVITNETNAMLADSMPKIQVAMAQAERAHVAATRK